MPSNIETQPEKSIIRVLLDPKIKLKELSVNDFEKSEQTGRSSLLQSKEPGNFFPYIKINNQTLNTQELDYMCIDSTEFLPIIKIIINLGFNTPFLNKAFPKDGDLIQVFIRSRNDVLKPIRNDYMITNTNMIGKKHDGTFSKILIEGILYIPGLFNEEVLYEEATSYDALFNIAKKLNLGFASNETHTNDKQIWINPNKDYINFIKHIAEHSWKDEKSFFDVFIDVYYNLNFVNVNNQFGLTTEIEQSLIDDITSSGSNLDNKEKQIVGKKILTNFIDARDTNHFIRKFDIINDSSDISINLGYKMYVNFFDHNSLKNWKIYTEGLVTEGAEKDFIILKGRNDGTDYDKQNRYRYLGIQYTLPEHNVHDKYYFSSVHNIMNNLETEKFKLKVELNRFNPNLYKFERIPCLFFTYDEDSARELDDTETKNENKEDYDEKYKASLRINKFYSGYYMIKGFRITYKDYINSHELILSKREFIPPV